MDGHITSAMLRHRSPRLHLGLGNCFPVHHGKLRGRPPDKPNQPANLCSARTLRALVGRCRKTARWGTTTAAVFNTRFTCWSTA